MTKLGFVWILIYLVLRPPNGMDMISRNVSAPLCVNKHVVISSNNKTNPLEIEYYGVIMVIRVVEFSCGGCKIRKILPKNQHTKKKLLNFENWVSGEVSKIGHHFSK